MSEDHQELEQYASLVPVPDSTEDISVDLSLDEQLALRGAIEISSFNSWKIDKIFFRRFADTRASQVAAYIINNRRNRYDLATLGDIQKKLWWHARAPLVYIEGPGKVDIFSCARGADFWVKGKERYSPSEDFKTAEGISKAEQKKRERFRYAHLADGTFWEDPQNQVLADANKTAYKLLIEAVQRADRRLTGEEFPGKRTLLLIFVLVKYLEDRGVFEKTSFFSPFYKDAKCFLDVLEKAKLEQIFELLKALKDKFNGDVFAIDDSDIKTLTEKDIRDFADMVNTQLIGQQLYLWDQYSFRYIPAEVLSHLYQHFADTSKEAYFTPPFLANLLLDYSMPYEELTGQERIFDPTCGSGVFLVGAFRRLIAVWRSQHDWKKPSVEDLKAILKRSIFGVELQADALKMAAFNLALAVCDALMPDIIWRELKFDNLIGSNLLQGDFFVHLPNLKKLTDSQGFDIILGNPPFTSSLTSACKAVESKCTKDAKLSGDNWVLLPGKQIAYAIARQCLLLLKNGGHLCLIQPASLLYTENTDLFWYEFLKMGRVEIILDFTSIHNLYYEANSKTVAIIVSNELPTQEHTIAHHTFRRTTSVKERICFELDHYDCHQVPQSIAQEYSYVWYMNLLGGGRMFFLSQRLRRFQTLDQYIKKQGWTSGGGFIVGDKKERKEWLTGKLFLPTKALNSDGIDESQLAVVEEEKFERSREPSRYEPPMVLIKENSSLHFAYWDRGSLTYKKSIVGINAPNTDEHKGRLLKFYERFEQKHTFIQTVCLLFSARDFGGREYTILKSHIDALPWPDDESDYDLEEWEKILLEDLSDSFSDFIRNGQKSKLLQQTAHKEDLERYASIYVKLLGAIYTNLKYDGYQSFGNLIAQRFYFGEECLLEWGDNWERPLKQLVYHECGEALRTVRVLMHHTENTMIIIKPKLLRYWIRSTAIYDADDTLNALVKQGY